MNAQRPWMGPPRRLDYGMTLVELLAVLSIVAILLGIGVPGMSRLVARPGRMAAWRNCRPCSARAAERGMTRRDVTLCGTADGSICSNAWNGNPTLVFIDANANRRADGDERKSGARRN